jgi:hypothetical protein
MSEMRQEASPPLPLSLDEIDRNWLTAAMRTRVPQVTVKDYSIVDVVHGTCTKARIRIDVDQVGREAGIPNTVILKGGFEPHSRAMYIMHELEGQFYRDVKPVLGLNSPDCYFADFDPAVAQGIIIMEDLVARGARFCNPLVPQTFEQAQRRLVSLAEYHAKTWNSPDFDANGQWSWVRSMADSNREHAEAYLNPTAWQPWVDLPRGRATSVRFHDVDWARHALDTIGATCRGLPRSVVVGDAHLGNLYEDADGTPGFVDVAAVCGPPQLELTYFLVGALDQADRRNWERPLVSFYLDELKRRGIDAPDLDETMHHYAMFLAYGYLVFLINANEWQPEVYNTVYTVRFSSAMLDHGTKELLDS